MGGIVLQMNHGIDGYMAGFTESLVQDALNTLVRGRTHLHHRPQAPYHQERGQDCLVEKWKD